MGGRTKDDQLVKRARSPLQVFGEALRELRQAKGVSASTAAQALHVSVPHMSHLETGKALPTRGFLKRAALYYEVPREKLKTLVPISILNLKEGRDAPVDDHNALKHTIAKNWRPGRKALAKILKGWREEEGLEDSAVVACAIGLDPTYYRNFELSNVAMPSLEVLGRLAVYFGRSPREVGILKIVSLLPLPFYAKLRLELLKKHFSDNKDLIEKTAKQLRMFRQDDVTGLKKEAKREKYEKEEIKEEIRQERMAKTKGKVTDEDVLGLDDEDDLEHGGEKVGEMGDD